MLIPCSFFLCSGLPRLFRSQQGVHLRHDLEGVGDVEHVGFAARPSATGVEVNGAPLADEAPANRMRFLAVAAGSKSFRVSGRRAGLPDLIQVAQEAQCCLVLSREIDQGFAGAQGCLSVLQEIQDKRLGFRHVRLTVLLFLGPSSARDK